MQKPLEIIYSQQSTDFIEGRAYSNPRFFTTPRAGVSKVYLVGEWPAVEAAYKSLGVPVERLDAADAERAATPPAAAAELVPQLAEDERAKVYIPEDWRDLPWSRPTDAGLTLRGLAAVFADVPVINKAVAIEAIEAELARRTGADDAPVDGTAAESEAE